MENTFISKRMEEKDFGVMFPNVLSLEKYCNEIIGETYNLLRIEVCRPWCLWLAGHCSEVVNLPFLTDNG